MRKDKFIKGKVYYKGIADNVDFVERAQYEKLKTEKGEQILAKSFDLKEETSEPIFRFCISSQVIDRDGDIVVQKGIDYTDFIKNPVVFWGHEWGGIPIGKVVSVTRDDVEDKTYADVVFGRTSRAQEVKLLVEDGIVQATSIGFAIKEWDYEESTGTFVITQSSLLELSIVGLPANQEAVGVEEVKSLEDLNESLTKGIDETLGTQNKSTLTFTKDGITLMTSSETDALQKMTKEELQEMLDETLQRFIAQQEPQDEESQETEEPTQEEEPNQEEQEEEVVEEESSNEDLLARLEALEQQLLETQKESNDELESEDTSQEEAKDEETEQEDSQEEAQEASEDLIVFELN